MQLNFVLLNIQCLISKRTNKLNSQELRNIFASNDLVMLNETWTDDYSDLSFDGFKTFWLSRSDKNCNSKRNSGGIAIYLRDEFCNAVSLYKQDGDDILWLRFEGVMFDLNHDVFVCLCYIVPADSSRQPYIELNVIDRISDHILEIANQTNEQYHLLICGDFNGRTGTEADYVIFDNARNNPTLPDNYELDVELQRFSQDHIINRNGRNLLQFCKAHNLRLCNGRFGDDKGVGKFTYIGHNGKSVIDYVIMSPSLIHSITRFYVDEPNILSDHCAVYFSLRTITKADDITDNRINAGKHISKKYVWDSEKADDFKFNIDSNAVAFMNLQHQLSSAVSGQDIDCNLADFTILMDEVCDPLFARNENKYIVY